MKPVNFKQAVDLIQKKSKLEGIFESIDANLKAIMDNQLQIAKLLVELLERTPKAKEEKPVDEIPNPG